MKKIICMVALTTYSVVILSCAGVQAPKPKVQLSPSQYPNSRTFDGVAIAVLLFDPYRDLYADPNDPNPRKPDFNWFKAGVCPTRFIFSNESQNQIMIDPSQITCVDNKGVTYVPYNAKEAGDAIVSSEAFGSYVRGAVAGAVVGALIGAGLGAALGGGLGGRAWAARGAAIGAASGGGQGLVLGSVRNRSAMEMKVRSLMISNQLMPKPLSTGMTHEGLIYFPAVQIQSVRVLLSYAQNSIKAEIPVVMPIQDRPIQEVQPQEAQPQTEGFQEIK
jgi:hypothetical protein